MSNHASSLTLRWIASSSTSALHAADALLAGKQLADQRVAQVLGEPVEHLQQALAALGSRGALMWSHLVPLSAGIESNQQLVDVAARKALGSGAGSYATLVGAITMVENAFRQIFPQLADELALRGKPLRELWDARGPGLLRRISQLTDESILPPSAEVVLVQPVLGGAGAAHLLYNSVRIEGVLANPWPNLPEVVRLAWLLSQLQLELPRFGENVMGARLPWVASLAMLPATLAAAEHVELVSANEQAVEFALRAWALTDSPEEVAELLWQWWETYCEDRPTLALALRALERILLDNEYLS